MSTVHRFFSRKPRMRFFVFGRTCSRLCCEMCVWIVCLVCVCVDVVVWCVCVCGICVWVCGFVWICVWCVFCTWCVGACVCVEFVLCACGFCVCVLGVFFTFSVRTQTVQAHGFPTRKSLLRYSFSSTTENCHKLCVCLCKMCVRVSARGAFCVCARGVCVCCKNVQTVKAHGPSICTQLA